MKRQNRQFKKFISLLKFPGFQYIISGPRARGHFAPEGQFKHAWSGIADNALFEVWTVSNSLFSSLSAPTKIGEPTAGSDDPRRAALCFFV